MAGRRTDLALEAKEIWEEGAAEAAVLEGVEAAAGEREGFPTETVRILDPVSYTHLTLPTKLEV